jgi:hypothetical protein
VSGKSGMSAFPKRQTTNQKPELVWFNLNLTNSKGLEA